MIDEKKLLAHLKETLSADRYAHTLSVARWAKALARRHGLPQEKAWRAGLLHDLAKEMPGPALARYVQRRRLSVPGQNEILRRRLFGLLHAHVSADRARREWGEKDPAVLSAIAIHTLGRARLSPLDKVLYVADFSAPGRLFGPAARVRRAARRSLDDALRETVKWKIRYVLESGAYLHPETIKLWNALARP